MEANTKNSDVKKQKPSGRHDSQQSLLNTWHTAPTRHRNRDSGASYQTKVRESLLPPPLQPRPVVDDPSINNLSEEVRPPMPPTRLYGGSASKMKERLGVDEVTVDFDYLQPRPSHITPTVPARTRRKSLNRLSLTPSEMPYPINSVRAHEQGENNDKAEEMLGLRRTSIAPPVPPKDHRRDHRICRRGALALPCLYTKRT